MKKIISILLSFSIVFLSVSTCISISVCADTDKTVLSKSSNSPFAYSSSEAQKYVSAHLDIYDSDNTLLFSYTPTSTYNWTYSAKGKDNLHLSDNQLKAFLMSKKTLSAYVQLMFSGFSNNNVTRGFLSALGIATTGNSNALTDVSDKLLGNYNYIDSINYDEDTQTITMDNASVDKLREEIKKYYYISNGMFELKSNTHKLGDVISTTWYDDMTLYQEDFNILTTYDYILYTTRGFLSGFNASDIGFIYYNGVQQDQSNYHRSFSLTITDKDLNVINFPLHYNFNATSDYFSEYEFTDSTNVTFCLQSSQWSSQPIREYFDSKGYWSFYSVKFNNLSRNDSLASYLINYDDSYLRFYSKDGLSLYGFTSYEKLFNYIHGESSAYLGSAINKVGEDISFSIKDMNENLGDKMDTLIDSINSNKSNMSADELQNAIDKGLEDLNKNTEDIKDNTSDILDTLKEQNNILLQILGVTEYIAYQNDKYNNTYTKADMSNLFKKSFNRVSDAVLYGEKVDDDNENTVDRSKFSYHNGIFGHFPFSVPYQLYEWLKVFQAEPECPEFTYHYGFLIGISKDNDEYDKYKITFNLSAYDSWRKVAASFLKLSFTLTMAIGTYKKFKGEL